MSSLPKFIQDYVNLIKAKQKGYNYILPPRKAGLTYARKISYRPDTLIFDEFSTMPKTFSYSKSAATYAKERAHKTIEQIKQEAKTNRINKIKKIIETMTCSKGHEVKWIQFYDQSEGKLRYYKNLLPPHALLFCSKCEKSYYQAPVYKDSENNIRVNLSELR